MIQYRAFRNTDPPQLAEIWRSQPASRGLIQPMSVAVLDRFVLAKPTFDRQGLRVATEGNKLLGFAHAGFGPTEDFGGLSTEVGMTNLVMARPEVDPAVTRQLLADSEAYLLGRGARSLLGGAAYPRCPFYFGLYGGSQVSGLLDSDARLQAVFRDAGYVEAECWHVLRRDLAGFRPVVDRTQMQIRRHTTVETRVDPPEANWWSAVIFEPFERIQCGLHTRERDEVSASVRFWSMDTYVGAWGVHGVGIVDLEVATLKRRQGLATFLVGESLRQLHVQGVAMAEVHVGEQNASALRLYRNLGFEQVDRSVLYRKDLSSDRT